MGGQGQEGPTKSRASLHALPLPVTNPACRGGNVEVGEVMLTAPPPCVLRFLGDAGLAGGADRPASVRAVGAQPGDHAAGAGGHAGILLPRWSRPVPPTPIAV